LRVYAFELLRAQEFFIVELSYFIFVVDLDAKVIVPFEACDFLEKDHLWHAMLGLWKFLPF
jgi:hypothetical protein